MLFINISLITHRFYYMEDELLGEVTTPSSQQRLEPLLLWGDTIFKSGNICTPYINSRKTFVGNFNEMQIS